MMVLQSEDTKTIVFLSFFQPGDQNLLLWKLFLLK